MKISDLMENARAGMPSEFPDLLSKFIGKPVSRTTAQAWLYGGGNPFGLDSLISALDEKCKKLFNGAIAADLSEKQTIKLFIEIGLDPLDARLLMKDILASS